MRDATLEFRIALVPARWVPVFVRNVIVWLQAQRDGKFGWYSRFDVALRWLGRRIAWDPEHNRVHQRVEDLLKLPPQVAQHERERQAVEKELATLPSFWVLMTLFLLLFIGDLFGSIQLFKTMGFDGFRRLLLGFALSAVLFALPLLALRFYTKKTKHWFYLIAAVLLFIIGAIATIQLSETAAQSGTFALQDAAAGALLALAVIGPALLAKFLLLALLPVWQLRKERARLIGEITRAKRDQRMAQAYVRDFHLYSEWYGTHAAQIASVYRRAFARKYLAVHKDPQTLRQMLDGDSLQELDDATHWPEGITAATEHELPPGKPKRAPRTRKAPQLTALDGGAAKTVENPYARQP
jgi:hypothetical protein